MGHLLQQKNAWHAAEQALKETLGEKKTKEFISFRETFDFSVYKKRLEKAHVRCITLHDSTYPMRLKQIKNSPFVLYGKGDLSLLSKRENTIGIVGSRKITRYGSEVTEIFTRELVRAGVTIISGLALGVDATAHKTTVETGGKTIAVLGCGVDCCSPEENRQLYDQILASGGVILSEVPLGHPPTIGTFPARNRIVAGLSEGILVTEGSEDSGALITADFAFKNMRKVFAIPGPITSSLSKGPYKLIEKGATLVTKPEDVLHELQITNYQLPMERKIIGDSKEEQTIIALLENESLSFDEIVRGIKKDSAHVASLLSLMEIKGVITASSSNTFSLCRN